MELHGMSRALEGQMKKISKSEKMPERIYGGYYCAKCTREILREKARKV